MTTMRDLIGAVLADDHVGHSFTLAHGLVHAMEAGSLRHPSKVLRFEGRVHTRRFDAKRIQ
jgi:hypothetical protein